MFSGAAQTVPQQQLLVGDVDFRHMRSGGWLRSFLERRAKSIGLRRRFLRNRRCSPRRHRERVVGAATIVVGRTVVLRVTILWSRIRSPKSRRIRASHGVAKYFWSSDGCKCVLEKNNVVGRAFIYLVRAMIFGSTGVSGMHSPNPKSIIRLKWDTL